MRATFARASRADYCRLHFTELQRDSNPPFKFPADVLLHTEFLCTNDEYSKWSEVRRGAKVIFNAKIVSISPRDRDRLIPRPALDTSVRFVEVQLLEVLPE